MAPKNFENKIQGRFEGFKSTPPEAVWQNISSTRDRRKKRLLVLWWLFPALLIAGMPFALFYSQKAPTYSLSRILLKTDLQIHTGSNSPLSDTIELQSKNDSSKLKETKTTVGTYTLNFEKEPSDVPTKITKVDSSPSSKEPIQSANLPEAHFDNRMAIRFGDSSLSSEELLYYQFQETPSKNQKFWYRSIGIQLGSFIRISRNEAETTIPPSQSTLNDMNESGFKEIYTRFLEVAPYIEWNQAVNGFGFRTNLVYSATNFSKISGTEVVLGRQQSYGVGAGTNYTIHRGRFKVRTYLHFQGESITTDFSDNDSHNWFASNNSGMGFASQTSNTPPAYKQWVLSGEVGLRGSYQFKRPRWSVSAGAGYRNYFWQEKNATSANQLTISIPQLIHLNVGVSYDF